MTEVRLKEMRLINCGCFADQNAEFGNTVTVIAGRNGSGKTTIADAWCWLWTDKLMNGKTADFRPHDENGTPLNDNSIFVTAYITINGSEYIIDKMVEKTEKGNETTYSVNGMQKRPRDFRAWVEDTLNITAEQVGYCISAAHFLSQDTAHRKASLYDLVTVDADEKLAADDERFVELVPKLQVATLDECLTDCRRAVKGYGKSKGCERELDELYARFDELSRAVAELGQHEYFTKRLPELAEQTKTAQHMMVEAEKTQDLLREFARYKAQLYEERVNSLFQHVSFTFSEPTSGDPKDICDMRYQGERYSKRLNTGARLLADTDIVRGFQRGYNVFMPLFVDNAESADNQTVQDMNAGNSSSQIIALYVHDCELEIDRR